MSSRANLRVTILGCGSSGGVPRIGGPGGLGNWGACDPNEPKNHRTRCSILVQKVNPKDEVAPENITSVLVDTSPDMRRQLLAAQCARLDAVLYTHDHADQAHGIDDLRALALSQRARVPVFIDDDTAGALIERFSYCFERAEGSYYPPILDRRKMPAHGETVAIDGPSGPISATPFLQFHGGVNSLGFRFGDIAYSSDLVGLPPESFDALAGVKIWIVDALQLEPHATHAHLDLTLEWIEKVKPERAILTNLHITMDYQALKMRLPEGVEPAYDGMKIAAAG